MSRAPLWWGATAFALTLTAALVGLRLQEDGIAIFWPAAGVASGLMLLTSGRNRGAVAFGVVVALSIGNITQQRTLAVSLVLMAGNLAQSYLVANALERVASPFNLDSLRNVAALVLLSLAAPAAIGLVTGLGLGLAQHPTSGFAEVWMLWFGSHAVGLLTVAPAIVSLRGMTAARLRTKAADLAAAFMVGVLALVLIGAFIPKTSAIMLVAIVIVPPLAWWMMIRASAARVAWALLALSAVTVGQTTGRLGVFADDPFSAQIVLAVSAAMLLSLGATTEHLKLPNRRAIYDDISVLRAGVLLIPTMLFAALAWWGWRDAESAAHDRAARIAHAAAEHAHRVFELQRAILEAALGHVQGRDVGSLSGDRTVHEYLGRLEKPTDTSSGIALIRLDTGRVLVDSRIFPFPDVDLSERDYVRVLRNQSERLFISELLVSLVSKEIGFTVALRDPANELIAVSRVPPDYFRTFYAGMVEHDRDLLALLRSDGTILARSPGEAPVSRLPASAAFFTLIGSGAPAAMIATGVDGVTRLFHARQVASYPIHLVAGLDLTAIRANWLRQIAPFGLLALAASGALLWFVSRIARDAEAVEAARWQAEHQRALAAMNERLSLALQAATAGAWAWSVGSDRFTWSKEIFELYGADPDGPTPTLEEWRERYLHPDDSARVRREFAAVIRGTAPTFSIDFRVLHRTLGVRWIAARGRVEREGSRAVKLTGLNIDITDRKAAEETLIESERRLRFALESAGAGIWECWPDTGAFTASARALELYGLPPGAAMTHEKAVAAVHPDDRANVEDAMRRSIENGEPFHMEIRVPQPDGSIRWVESTAEVRRDFRGRRLVGLVRDITGQKRSDEHIRLLMREVNHRAKNMLSVVQSVARHTVASDRHDFMERFEQRLAALAANQDLLVRSEWKGVPLEALVRSQLAHYGDLIGTRIMLSGPEVTISPSASQALGMALHELGTNAGKYGALSNDDGRITVAWTLSQEGGRMRFAMDWTESGGPPVAAPARNGFGTSVVVKMVRMMLNGEVVLDYADSGVHWRVMCAANDVIEV